MSISNSYPTQRATLNLDFANSGKLDSRLSYSRSSGGTYMSNEKSLNSENLISQSADLGSWTEGSSSYTTVTSNATTAPDGTTTAAQITGLTGTGKKAIYHPISAGTGNYTGVAYVKPDGHEYVQITFGNVSTVYQNYHLSSTGTLGNGNNDGASIDKFGDWYRITLTSNVLSSATNLYLVMVDSNTAVRYEDSTSTSSIFAWGANFSSTNQKVFNSTSGSIHREFAPLLKTAAANAPRFEYAADGQSEGLLIEAQATNYMPNSELDAGYVAYRLTASAGACVGPTGALAQVFTETTETGDHYIADTFPTTLDYSKTYTASVYAKKVASGTTDSRLKFRINGMGGQAYAGFDLVNGNVTQQAGSAIGSAVISAAGNGWYRISMTWTNEAADRASGIIVSFNNNTASSLASYVGDGFTSYALAGLMVEEASAPSSLIQTNGSSVTRAADSCSVALTSVGNEVTVAAEAISTAVTSDRETVFHITPLNANTVSAYAGRTAGGGASNVFYGGSSGVYLTGGTVTAGSAYKFALRTAPANHGMSYNGGTVATQTTTVSGDDFDTLHIGSRSDGSNAINGHVKRLSLFNVALSNTELKSLTN